VGLQAIVINIHHLKKRKKKGRRADTRTEDCPCAPWQLLTGIAGGRRKKKTGLVNAIHQRIDRSSRSATTRTNQTSQTDGRKFI
jgi:hypothetical protein